MLSSTSTIEIEFQWINEHLNRNMLHVVLQVLEGVGNHYVVILTISPTHEQKKKVDRFRAEYVAREPRILSISLELSAHRNTQNKKSILPSPLRVQE